MIEFELRKHLDLFSAEKYVIPIHPSIKFGVVDTGLALGGQYNLGTNIKSGVKQVTPALLEGEVTATKPWVKADILDEDVGSYDPTNLGGISGEQTDGTYREHNPGKDPELGPPT